MTPHDYHLTKCAIYYDLKKKVLHRSVEIAARSGRSGRNNSETALNH